MNIQRLASFCDGSNGGNPAGVCISDKHPPESDMQAIAAKVGYSETAFAEPTGNGWRVRYFSPETEVPFCGHATIALGAALAQQQGSGVFPLTLNNTSITVEGTVDNNVYTAALQSPETSSGPAPQALLSEALTLFGYTGSDLDPRIPAAIANGGAEHLIIALNCRNALAAMEYRLDEGRNFMRNNGIVTVMFVYAESEQLFHSRNPFASGGVYEDPATGAATAAFAGYLRDLNCPHANEINIVQGEDMGSKSLIKAQFTDVAGSSIRISGTTRVLES